MASLRLSVSLLQLGAMLATTTDTPAFVICGPSGVGKSTILSAVLEKFPGKFTQVLMDTTRAPRPREKQGVDYNFVQDGAYDKKKNEGKILINDPHNGAQYGMSYEAFGEAVASGKIPLVQHISSAAADKLYKSGILPNAKFMLVVPPGESWKEQKEVLISRLNGRGTDNRSAERVRLHEAVQELSYEDKHFWNKVLVNDVLHTAIVDMDRWIETTFELEPSRPEFAETATTKVEGVEDNAWLVDSTLWAVVGMMCLAVLRVISNATRERSEPSLLLEPGGQYVKIAA